MNTMNVNPNRFLRHWLASAIAAWPVSGIACLLAWIPFAVVSSILAQYESLELLARLILMLGIFTIPGLSIGYIIGDMQNTLLRDLLHRDFDQWIRYSSIGGLIGGFLVITGNFVASNHLSEHWQWMLMLPLFILPVCVMQYLLLRQSMRDAWMWIIGNIVAAIVFSGLLFNAAPFPFSGEEPFYAMLMWFVAAAASGMITGIVMLWLHERPTIDPYYDDDDAELAPVYIEVRNRDQR